MLYLLDANVLITANSQYYPIDQVPEFWGWIQHQAIAGHVKIPLEVMEEIKEGRREGDLLIDWILQDANNNALLFDEAVDPVLVQRVVHDGEVFSRRFGRSHHRVAANRSFIMRYDYFPDGRQLKSASTPHGSAFDGSTT
jgi:Domain of unknown function (DUF4411)